ncbi:MAG: cupin domain-containing protein [Burkholderiales bacterium]
MVTIVETFGVDRRPAALVFLGALALGAVALLWTQFAPRPLPAADVTGTPPFVICSPAGADAMLATDGRPRPTPRVVSSETMSHLPGKRVTMVLVDFPPGSHSPAHRHSGSVSVYVLKGEIYSQLGQGPMQRFGPGGTFFEPPGMIHTASGNDGEQPAQVLAVFVHDEGAVLTTYLE